VATKTIAIIGAIGNVGSGIATRLAKANYRLLLFAHEPKALASLAKAIKQEVPGADIECVGCAANATWEADIIISTASLVEEEQLAGKIEPFTNRKILISISSYEDGDNLVASRALRATRQLQKLFPGTKVVKLFNVPFDNEWHGPTVMTSNDEEALQVAEEILSCMENYRELNNKVVA
jgi:8-hydroxy-5-deazaflavin:NADPH oxidoreductase